MKIMMIKVWMKLIHVPLFFRKTKLAFKNNSADEL